MVIFRTIVSEFLIRHYSHILLESDHHHSVILYNNNAASSNKQSKKLKIPYTLINELLTPLNTNEAHLKNFDPLLNWFYRRSDVSARMMSRIQNLAAFISGNIKWAFLVEPGHAKTDLSVGSHIHKCIYKVS